MRASTQSGTGRRLMVYLSGLAIGFVLLGVFSARRASEMQARQVEQAQRAAEQSSGTPGGQPSVPAEAAQPE